MKQLIIVALIAAAAVAERDYDAMFREFKATHLKAYANQAEEDKRFKTFVENMKKAEVLQAANPLANFGPNKFSDMSAAEFKAKFLNGEAYYRRVAALPRAEVAAPLADRVAAAGESIDWRQKGVVTPIKDQGSCGSCWAYSATGNIEGQWAIAGNTLTALSEQELVSCDPVDSGCDGGLMDNAFEWLLSARKGEIVTEAAYPYASASGYAPSCKTGELASMPVGAVITSYKHLERSEDTLAAYVLKTGPVSVAVDATSFQSYAGGILTNCISWNINHGVLAVGFDDGNVPPYWIIKNSWGTSWGENGYIRVAKGSNQCLINQYCTTAIVGSNATKH